VKLGGESEVSEKFPRTLAQIEFVEQQTNKKQLG